MIALQLAIFLGLVFLNSCNAEESVFNVKFGRYRVGFHSVLPVLSASAPATYNAKIEPPSHGSGFPLFADAMSHLFGAQMPPTQEAITVAEGNGGDVHVLNLQTNCRLLLWRAGRGLLACLESWLPLLQNVLLLVLMLYFAGLLWIGSQTVMVLDGFKKRGLMWDNHQTGCIEGLFGKEGGFHIIPHLGLLLQFLMDG